MRLRVFLAKYLECSAKFWDLLAEIRGRGRGRGRGCGRGRGHGRGRDRGRDRGRGRGHGRVRWAVAVAVAWASLGRAIPKRCAPQKCAAVWPCNLLPPSGVHFLL